MIATQTPTRPPLDFASSAKIGGSTDCRNSSDMSSTARAIALSRRRDRQRHPLAQLAQPLQDDDGGGWRGLFPEQDAPGRRHGEDANAGTIDHRFRVLQVRIS